MRAACYFVLIFALLGFVDGQAEEFPARKPGLWEMKMTQEGRPDAQASRQCVDEQTDAQMREMGASMSAQLGGGSCASPEIRSEGGGYVVESECSLMGTRMKSRAVFKGDFASSYSGQAEASYDPPLMGMAKSKTNISARWLGPCEPGQKPGDIIMPNGMKLNLQDMRQMGEVMKRR